MIDYILDPVFGKYEPSELIEKLILSPEFQRLREVRLSNINSLSLVGWSNQSRYEHSLGVAFLSKIAAEALGIDEIEKCHLIIAGLLHDIATPPFSHTTEHVFNSLGEYNHEENARYIIEGVVSDKISKYGRFTQFCGKEISIHRTLSAYKIGNEKLDPHRIFELVQGRTELGKLIKKDIDLDNIDSVYRMAHHIGLPFNKKDPIETAQSYKLCGGQLGFSSGNSGLIDRWLGLRKKLYTELMTNKADFSAKCMLTVALENAYKNQCLKESQWTLTDNELMDMLNAIPEARKIITRLRLGELFSVSGIFWIKDRQTIDHIISQGGRELLDKEIKSRLGEDFYVFWILDSNKLSRRITLDVFDDPFSKNKLVSTAFGTPSYSLLLGVLCSSESKGLARKKIESTLLDILHCELIPVEKTYFDLARKILG